MKKIIAVLTASLLTANSYAMFCPNGFNLIDFGDSIEQVIKQCGNPDAKKVTKSVPEKPQEWSYFVKPDPTQPGTLKMSVAFDSDKKVINITVNGTSLTNTTICNGNTIQYGDTDEVVKAACGDPAYKNQPPVEQPAPGSPPVPTTEITELTYNTAPVTVLVFENGKFKEKK